MIQSLVNKLIKYSLAGVLVVSFASAFNTLYQNSAKLNELRNSNFVSRYINSTGSLFGYDDNEDGFIDRIEEEGLIPFKTGTPAFRIEKTHLPTDKDYQRYSKRLETLGTVYK